MSDPTLTYQRMDPPFPPEPDHDLAGNPNAQLLGYYKVRYEDGLTVALPHTGVQQTLGAKPLDLDDPYERSLLLKVAGEARERRNQP